MAKVLACPACGHKHPLDLLVGLDSFACKECGKKLAVPNEALPLTKTKNTEPPRPVVKEKQPVETVAQPTPAPVVNPGEITIVARASMSPDVRPGMSMPVPVEAERAPESPQVVSQMSEPQQDNVSAPSKQSKPLHTIKSVPIFGSLLEWVVAIPAGFFIVVIIPRFFGFGFHASDFVDVITTQGLGRYSIVIRLIFFWSVATVACVSLFNIGLSRFLDSRKAKKVSATV